MNKRSERTLDIALDEALPTNAADVVKTLSKANRSALASQLKETSHPKPRCAHH